MEKTFLFVPGNKFERIGKAIDSTADAVIIDLEDAVAVEEKSNAITSVRNALKQFDINKKTIFVRINDLNSPFWKEDLDMVMEFPSIGVMLPKTESANDILILDKFIKGRHKLIPLIESAKGVLAVESIASASRNISRLAFGAVDYCLDLGITFTENEMELIHPRSMLVLASKAADIESPIDTVYTNIHDEEGLKKETGIAKQLGLFAKLCIHPKQIKVIHQVLAVSNRELQWARKIVTAFEKAESQGLAALKVNGEMVDYPVYKKALALLEKETEKVI